MLRYEPNFNESNEFEMIVTDEVDNTYVKYEDHLDVLKSLKRITSELSDVVNKINNGEKLTRAENTKIVQFYGQVQYMSNLK